MMNKPPIWKSLFKIFELISNHKSKEKESWREWIRESHILVQKQIVEVFNMFSNFSKEYLDMRINFINKLIELKEKVGDSLITHSIFLLLDKGTIPLFEYDIHNDVVLYNRGKDASNTFLDILKDNLIPSSTKEDCLLYWKILTTLCVKDDVTSFKAQEWISRILMDSNIEKKFIPFHFEVDQKDILRIFKIINNEMEEIDMKNLNEVEVLEISAIFRLFAGIAFGK